ncbi:MULTISPECIES: hypothetical protein [Dysgonomonas]|uniref:hypothetical protein n=1 Tax=Dysgonomonas TaxID=156973 RepID=UPI00092C6D79|nr:MULTISPECIES: hypothetical protein [Dysgonomonas]MBN9301784.1 hypothetical protein [Dysgonomonas mossii]OJX63044.1 MAG: hypothetical protein BGO84_14160 [Dysgonomonas sp. 37-18]
MEISYDRKELIRIDNPDRFLKYILWGYYKKKNFIRKYRLKRLDAKYKNFQPEIRYGIKLCVEWGFVEKNEVSRIKVSEFKEYINESYEITKKGEDALKWRIFTPFYPGWLSENRKYAITTIISIIAIIISIVALLRTLQ